ncbi:hypothetical protein PQX77_021858 [Marasmius sp. AFHP31]|nr:hypothetical protein PQX77_021858 [Marasmius sp. AFHP31]
MATYFSHAQGTTIGDHASFLSIAGNPNTYNYNYNHNYLQRDRIFVNGRAIRVVMDSDIHCLRVQSSKILSVDVEPDDKASTSSKLQAVRLKKMVQTAEVSGWQGRFTATTLELVDVEDQDLFKKVTHRREDWSIDFQTLTCQYNPANISLIPPSEEHLKPYLTRLPPLRQDAVPQLNPTKIIAHVEENLGDFLYLIAAAGGSWIDNLSNYAQNGLLTFGAIVQRKRPGSLAHFPSTPSPELFCKSRSPDVEASYSNSGRVDLSFQNTDNVNVTLHFGFCRDMEDVVCIDQVGFRLKGIFCEDPTTHSKPAYLFIRPLHTELINGLHCLRHPLSKNIFYWSNDPQGRDKIAEKDWERLRIPQLRVQGLIGSYWNYYGYAVVQELLHLKNRDSDGKQYARERGYPKLIPGDPHNSTRFKELESSEPDSEPETPPSPSRLTSPSTYSLVEAPLEPKLESEDAPTVPTSKEIMVTPTRWVRGFLNKFYNTPDRSMNVPKATGTEELSDGWTLVSREGV